MSLRHALIAELLRGRRAELQPEDVGIPRGDGRRVPGLRREEVAELAGINRDYYIRLEQAHGHLPSPQVVSALSRALQLDPDTTEYFQQLAQTSATRALSTREGLPAGAFAILRLVEPHPAYITNGVHDVLVVNRSCAGIAKGFLDEGRNLLIEVFEHEHEAPSAEEWRATATRLVDSMRFHTAPDEPRFQELLALLRRRYPAFRELWSRQRARKLTFGTSLFYDAEHGWQRATWQTLIVPDHPDSLLTIIHP
ncbi:MULTISPECIES: helix-turn-helix domain-containing protein [Microbacterium]|uniref:Transcriptional regulator n=1 Tax=Microbacterium barkeri TaxID=33917 RepID=A0A9W6LVE4_9MICO|nr:MULTISPECIES: helix-turn-helix domain-containing protein [Microbacterium]MDI6942245.1 helix-turn-helix domain-containing protein [Microbacterium barkeri]MDR6876118.1 transcriptional regulator with XRE-family HTH domain [Microbacterium barkeri]WRH17375.1 helix-turn-helix domain-containing protein [Microbacterium sp. JZ37]GLJ60236.1 transcriptional regulator [Microbacterium barkeri]